MDDALYGQLEQTMVEPWNARQDAHQETIRRVKVEREPLVKFVV